MDISEQDRADRKKEFLSFFDLYELKDTLMEDIKTMIHHKRHRLVLNFAHIFHHRVQKGPDGYDLSRRYKETGTWPRMAIQFVRSRSRNNRDWKRWGSRPETLGVTNHKNTHGS